MAARWAHNPKVVGSNPTPATKLSMWHTVFFSLGGKSAMDPPVPIPNTEVKLRSADDTASARVWENRSPPGDYLKKPAIEWVFLFVYVFDLIKLKVCWFAVVPLFTSHVSLSG